MAGIGDIVSVTITANSRTPTRAGFGTPLLLGYHTRFPETVRTYTDLAGMAADGFTVADSVYLMARQLLAQSPRVERFKVGRLPAAPTRTQTLTVTTATEGQHIKATVHLPDGTTSAIDYTIPAAQTTTQVATSVSALIDALASVAATSAVAVITATPSTAGQRIYFSGLTNLTYKETTVAAGYDTALTALQAVDDDWYLVLIDSESEANIDAVAAWAETRTKLFLFSTSDDGEKAGTGTVFSDLRVLGYDRSAGVWAPNAHEYAAAAWAGRVLPKDPGAITWAMKELTGVTPATLNATQETALLTTNNANTYQSIAGLGIVRWGKAVGGEYMDVVHGIDWLTARIQERVFGVIANADKVPYTDRSVDAIKGEINAVLLQAVDRSFLKEGTISISAPKVADVDIGDRAARTLPDVKFAADLAGAIHKVSVVGTLAV